MNNELIDDLQINDVIREMALDGFGELYEQYSGRGMYGDTCLGLVTDSPNDCIEEAASRGLRGGKQDNMGRQYIVYWPHVRG